MASPTKSPTKPRADLRRGLSRSENETTPVTPPTRFISSNLSTPGSAYGKEDDAVIIELSPRYLKAGIEGESHPQIRYDFTPEKAQKLGDYRQYLPGYTRQESKNGAWGEGHELWRNDLKNFDLGLLSDKVERAVREIYNKHLLLDTGHARLVLVVPGLLPHPVLATILQTILERWSFPTVTLFPTPVTALVAAGVRSGLVIEIGWEETTVTAVYEYREVFARRSTRASKLLTRKFVEWAEKRLPHGCMLDLETVEEFLARIARHVCDDKEKQAADNTGTSDTIDVQWPTSSFTQQVTFLRSELKAEIQQSLLGNDIEEEGHADDEELPVQQVIYNVLLNLPPDIRGICISRMMFIGDGADQLGLQSLITKSFSRHLEAKGWSTIQGKKVRRRREGLSELAQGRVQPVDVRHSDTIWTEKAETEERYLREKHKHIQPATYGVVRQIDTLGSWAGASLLGTLKVKSFVEIQRERFLSHGLVGASRDLDLNTQTADTPPASPTSPTEYDQALANRQPRIQIDENGVHDFDLRRRQSEAAGSKKLRKFSRQSQPNSISSMTDIERIPSNGSDTSSLRKRFSALLPGGKSEVQKANSIRSTRTSLEVQEDPLPETKKELEIRLNHHLSELDILKKTINSANDVIRQHYDRYEIMQTRGLTDMTRAMQMQEDLIHQARKNRDSWVEFVSFHRRQIVRIKHKRIEIELDAGLEPTLPQVYKQLWGDDEWSRLFMS
ncbi:hypothetical protein LTS08_000580 [Lithohypha guttulata]|nr:hypothetical protein LTS08_000580 [Lithohypha guttulata]